MIRPSAEYFGQDKVKSISDSHVPLRKDTLLLFAGTLEYLNDEVSVLSADILSLFLARAFLRTGLLVVVKYAVSSCSCLKEG